MSYESKDPNQEKASLTPKAGRKEVDLFPALDKALPAPIRTQGGTRLGTQISIYNPVSYEEAMDIVESLRTRSASTICLEKMKKTDAGRLVDFVAGASAALDGDFHKLTEQVYVFCPSNIKIQATKPEVVVPTTSSEKIGNGALDFLFSATDKNKFSNAWSTKS